MPADRQQGGQPLPASARECGAEPFAPIRRMGDDRLVRGVRFFCVALLLLGGLVAAPVALGAFPGTNGRIVVQTTNGLDTINSGGGERLHLVSESGVFATPTWSADGRRIAFASNRSSADFEIYSMGAQGGGITPLTNNTVEDDGPSWSPNGSRIAFARVPDVGPSQIYVMNADGTGELPLISGILEDSAPAWSPDGTRIAFARGSGGNSDIWTITSSGGSATPLTTDPANETNPDWSPDGSTIVFQRGDTIVVMSASGAAQTPLPVPSGAQRPAWAPDGTRIVFDVAQQVWSVNPDGTGATPLTTAGTASLIAQAPSWQPIPQGGGGTGPPGPGGDKGGPGTRAPLLHRSVKASLRTNRSGRYTLFAKLSVSPVRRGDTLRLTCKGRGCPLKRLSVHPKKSRKSVSLLGHLRGAKLRKGAVVQLLVSHRATVGRATTWKIRAPKSPRVIHSCVSPGKSKLTRCPG
jgi:WD40 repeat protein